MLRYFRINDPYRLLALLILMAVACLPLLIDAAPATLQEIRDMVVGERIGNKILYVDLVDRTPPLMALLDGFIHFLFGRSGLARHLVVLLLLFFQAAYFAILLINNRAYNENTYVPSLIFASLCFLSFDFLSLTPELFASTLMLLALNNVFKEIEFRVDRDTIVLNLGVFIGLASLVVLSYAIFLPGAILILILFARTSLRKILLVLLGFSLVHGILFTLYYFYGHPEALWRSYYVANALQSPGLAVSVSTLAWIGAIPVFYFLISLVMMTREARFTKYQSQIFQVLFIWLLLAVIEAFFTPALAPHAFITFLPPLAYFISHYLLLIRRRRIAEVMVWLFVGGILTVSYATRKGLAPKVDFSGLFARVSTYEDTIRNKRVMVVGDDMGLYRRNSLGGGFLDWPLSRRYFEHPEYYEHVIRMDNAFAEDPPDAIVDEANLMPAVFERLPAVRRNYQKKGVIYWRK